MDISKTNLDYTELSFLQFAQFSWQQSQQHWLPFETQSFLPTGAAIPPTAAPSLGTVFYSQRIQTSLYATNLSQKEQVGQNGHIERTKLALPHVPFLHQSHDKREILKNAGRVKTVGHGLHLSLSSKQSTSELIFTFFFNS